MLKPQLAAEIYDEISAIYNSIPPSSDELSFNEAVTGIYG